MAAGGHFVWAWVCGWVRGWVAVVFFFTNNVEFGKIFFFFNMILYSLVSLAIRGVRRR